MMAIKLKNLDKWQELPADKSLMLGGDGFGGNREITLNLNTEAATSFMAIEGGVEYFLGVVDGFETIVFTAEGEVEVSATSSLIGDNAGQVWYWTDDGDVHAFEHTEGYKLFVKPMTQEQRTPAMEAMAIRMQEKHDRRFALQAANNQALFDQIQRERADYVAAIEASKKPVDPSAGEGGGERSGEGVTPPAGGAGAGDGKSKA